MNGLKKENIDKEIKRLKEQLEEYRQLIKDTKEEIKIIKEQYNKIVNK
mgnify:CR=1 FL=1